MRKSVSGTHISEPPINTVADKASVVPEQRQLPVINTVPGGHIRSCHLVVEDVAPIYHSFCHQFSCAIIPSRSAFIPIGRNRKSNRESKRKGKEKRKITGILH